MSFTIQEKLDEIRRQITYHVQHSKRKFRQTGKPAPQSAVRRIEVLKAIAVDYQDILNREAEDDHRLPSCVA